MPQTIPQEKDRVQNEQYWGEVIRVRIGSSGWIADVFYRTAFVERMFQADVVWEEAGYWRIKS